MTTPRAGAASTLGSGFIEPAAAIVVLESLLEKSKDQRSFDARSGAACARILNGLTGCSLGATANGKSSLSTEARRLSCRQRVALWSATYPLSVPIMTAGIYGFDLFDREGIFGEREVLLATYLYAVAGKEYPAV